MKYINEKVEIKQTIKATAQSFSYPILREKKEVEKDGKKVKINVPVYKDDEPVLDKSKVQIATMILNEKTGLENRKTFTLHKELSEEELLKMRDKTFIFSGIQEYAHKEGDFTNYTYSAKDFKEIQSNEIIFELNKFFEAIVYNVAFKNEDTIFQLKIQDKLRISLMNVKLKGLKKEEFKSMIGKKCKFENLSIFKAGSNTFYSTKTAPRELK